MADKKYVKKGRKKQTVAERPFRGPDLYSPVTEILLRQAYTHRDLKRRRKSRPIWENVQYVAD
jgi:hypothetical protein